MSASVGDWVSPSQLDMFAGTPESCMRKWGFKYIDKIPVPPKPSAALGTAVHLAAEHYLKTGFIDLTTREGEILMPGLMLMPPPMLPGMQLEDHFGISIGAANVQGKRDIWIPHWTFVADHKTTSNKKWSKTSDVLKRDTQAVSYAIAAMAATGDSKASLRWIYYLTGKQRDAWPVDVTIYKNETHEIAADIEHRAKLIKQARTLPQANELPPNRNACDAYGGCPYKQHCNDTTVSALLGAHMTQQSFEEMLANRIAAGANGSHEAPPQAPWATQPPAPTPAMAPPPAPPQPPQAPWVQQPAPPQATMIPTQAPPAAAPWSIPAPMAPPQTPAPQPAQAFTPPAAPADPKPQRQRRTKEEKARDDGFVLYYACARVGGNAEDYAPRLARVQGYLSQGAPSLEKAVEYDLQQHPPIEGLVIQRGMVSDEVLALIASKALYTVRGL